MQCYTRESTRRSARTRGDIPNRTVEDEVTKPQNNRSNGQLSTSPVRVNRGEPTAWEDDGNFPRPRICKVDRTFRRGPFSFLRQGSDIEVRRFLRSAVVW